MSDPRAKGGKGGATAKVEAKKQTTQSARAGLQVSIHHPIQHLVDMQSHPPIDRLVLSAGRSIPHYA